MMMKKSFAGEVYNLIKSAQGDAINLVDVLVNKFSFFSDYSLYNGVKINFNKKVQLLASDINYVLTEGNKLSRVDYLTVCADYKLPQVLERNNILCYSDSLLKKLENKAIITKGSREEMVIRMATVLAIDNLAKVINKLGKKKNTMEISDYIWLEGQRKNKLDMPYHRTLTTKY